MATLKLLLDKGRTLKDGSFSLVFRIVHRRRKRVIYTPYKFSTTEFDSEEERVMHLSDDYRSERIVNTINRNLKKQRQSIDSHIQELELLGCDYTVDQIISRYRVEHDDLDLLGYIDSLICEKHKIGRIGIAIAYESTRCSLSRFLGTGHISLSNIDAVFVKNYEHHLMQRGVKPNTICYYIRNFKSVYAQAIYEGLEQPRFSPFRGVMSKPQRTVKRALDADIIRSIRGMEFRGLQKYYRLSRDLFMFSFLTRGMPFVDMFYLKKKNIQGDVIIYYRCKTGQCLQVALTDEAKELIKRYDGRGEYIFPMLNIAKKKDKDVRKAYRTYLDRTNRQLKAIGKMLNLEMPLTTYVARHCWATQAKEFGFSTSIISEGLGHSSEKVTQIYLKEFDQSVLDDANEHITKSLFS